MYRKITILQVRCYTISAQGTAGKKVKTTTNSRIHYDAHNFTPRPFLQASIEQYLFYFAGKRIFYLSEDDQKFTFAYAADVEYNTVVCKRVSSNFRFLQFCLLVGMQTI